MLTLLGSLLGFGTSFLPKVLDFFREGRDQKHELEVLKARAKIDLDKTQILADVAETKAIHKQDEVTIQHGSQWVATLSATVRPVITYVTLSTFVGLSVAVATNHMTVQQFEAIWSDELGALFAAIISYYFGARTYTKMLNNKPRR